jgi:hypothetical protein
MTVKLPATLIEAEMVDAVSQWVLVVQDRLTASPREQLEAACRDYLQLGLTELLQVIEAADNGDEIADAALCCIYKEMRDARLEPSLEAYAIKALERGPVTRKPGRATWFDNWRRDIGIAVLVFLTVYRFNLWPTRNREQRRRCQPSASSVVKAALDQVLHINITEGRVENIWGRLNVYIGRFIATAKIEVPSISAR